MLSASPLKKAVFFTVVICAALFLFFLQDDNLGLGWPTNVIHNWQQFGLLNLHGKLVSNPGGYNVTEHPDIYKGMSPEPFYPVYLATQILGWTGLGTLSFFVFLLPILLWGVWKLLGGDRYAALMAVIAILTSGYMRFLKGLDPNSLAVIPAIFYAIIILAIMRKPKLTPGLAAAAIIVTLAFMSLNWTTAWVCGPCLFLWLGMPGVNRRGLIFLVGVMAVAVLLVVAVSFASKATGDTMGSGSPKPLQVAGGYMWGNYGYGEGLTTGRAFLRLAFVNGVGLFPLGLVMLYTVARRGGSGAGVSWFAFTPLALAILDLVIMRNYFGHHPSMGGPLLWVGMVFSLALLRVQPAGQDTFEKIPFQLTPVLALLCFGYGLIVTMFFRANQADLFALGHLIEQHTARADTIVVVKENNPNAESLGKRLGEPLDRHVVVAENFQDLANEPGPCVILSPVKLDGPFVLATQSAVSAESWINKPGEWFNHAISRRSSDDVISLSGIYYLYKPDH